MIIKQKDITSDLNIWNKALNLKILSDAWYNVPGFVVIPGNIVTDINNNIVDLSLIVKQVNQELNISKYVVRSSSSLEDNSDSSMAWQFHTEIDVQPENLEQAILLTVEKSIRWSEETLWNLSLIIQEYITADHAWITFTRSPKWSRELVLEYHKWIWEDIVSWKIKPEIEKCYHSEITNYSENIVLKNIIKNKSESIWNDFINIEKLFWFPVDIEWCVKWWILYFLQARKITTISDKQYKEILVLEKLLENNSVNNKYFYEKNEISEVCPRPTPFMLSLFNKIYAKNWPLHNFYSKNKVSFQYVIPNNIDTHIIKIIWNELYIDKQREIESLLSWVNIFKKGSYKPNLWSLKWLFNRAKNLYFLFKIKENKWKIENYLHHYFLEDITKYSFNELLNNFLHVYETIYEINYFTSKSFKKLQLALKNEDISFSEIISINIELLDIDNLPKFNIDHSEFKWNSININDENIFVSQFNQKYNSTAELYWNTLPAWKQNYLRPIIADAIYYEYMREIGRHLTVKHISELRNNIDKISNKLNLKTLIYFASINEIISWNIDEELLLERKSEYNKYNNYNFPTSISDSFIREKNNSTTWISSWVSQWKLVNLENLNNIILDNKSNENIILFTNILSPELTKYFPYIHWIVSETWWELSHLAIMAREHSIPVVTNFSTSDSEINIWDLIEINGNNWVIIKK